jgi:hypothetical protein
MFLNIYPTIVQLNLVLLNQWTAVDTFHTVHKYHVDVGFLNPQITDLITLSKLCSHMYSGI